MSTNKIKDIDKQRNKDMLMMLKDFPGASIPVRFAYFNSNWSMHGCHLSLQHLVKTGRAIRVGDHGGEVAERRYKLKFDTES